MADTLVMLSERERFALETLLALEDGDCVEWPLDLDRNIPPFSAVEADELLKKLDTTWREAL